MSQLDMEKLVGLCLGIPGTGVIEQSLVQVSGRSMIVGRVVPDRQHDQACQDSGFKEAVVAIDATNPAKRQVLCYDDTDGAFRCAPLL